MKRHITAGLSLALLLLSIPAQARDFTLAVVPQYTVSEIYKNWQPLLSELERATGDRFKLLVYPSFRQFETDYLAGVPDFVYFNPYHQLVGNRAQGYIPLVRDGKRKLTGIIVVRKDSGIDSITQLQGMDIAFPAPNAFAASLYMRTLLSEKEGLNFHAYYVQSHSNGYRHVYTGKALAAGGVISTLRRQPAAIRNELKVIYQTPAYPPHPIAAHPRVSPTVRSKLTAVLLELQGTAQGRQLLSAIQMAHPIRAEYRRDYTPLGLLGLDRYYRPYE